MKLFKYCTACTLLLFCFLHSFAQTAFIINKKGEVTTKNYPSFLVKNKYQLVSAFDTVSKNPLLVYALYMKDKKFGILDINGREITKPIYTEITGLNASLPTNYNGFHSKYIVKIDKKYGLISNKGKEILPVTYDFLFYENKDSVFLTYTNNQAIYLNDKGEKIAYTTEEEQFAKRKYQPDFEKTLNKEKTQYYIKDNRYKSPPFSAPNLGTPISVFRSRAIFKDQNNKYGLFDGKTQKLVIPVIYDALEMAGPGGYYIVRNNGKYGAIDSLGNIKCAVEYRSINRFTGGSLIYNDQKLALFDSAFNPMSGFIYDGYSRLSNHEVVLKKDGKYGLLEMPSGKIIVDFLYDYIKLESSDDLKKPILLLTNNSKIGIADLTGKIISPIVNDLLIPECLTSNEALTLHEEMMFISNTPNLYFFFKKDGKYGLLDNDYNVLLNNEYDMILKTDKELVSIMKNGKWGLFNVKSGKNILPLIYDTKIVKNSGCLLTYKNGFYGLSNIDGKDILPNTSKFRISTDVIYKGLLETQTLYSETIYIDYLNNKVAIPNPNPETPKINEIAYRTDGVPLSRPTKQTLTPNEAATLRENLVYSMLNVDKIPSFVGGINARKQYFETNLKYSEKIIQNGTKGQAIVSFIVEKDGSITDIKFIKSVCQECNKEISRVILNSPKWKPGFKDGKPVRVRFETAIMFNQSTSN